MGVGTTHRRWRKSSYSSASTSCLEAASGLGHVRDSRNPTGPVLHVDLTALLTKIKTGDLDR